LTTGTDFRRSLVFVVLSFFGIVPSFQDVSRWADKGVIIRVIGEVFFGKDVLPPTRSSVGLLNGGHVSLDASIITCKEILYGAVLAVSYCGGYTLMCVMLMRFNHFFKKGTIISGSRGNAGCGNYLTSGIYPSMRLVAKF
jgi:hypothetical protein